jgi:hypothetical protein
VRSFVALFCTLLLYGSISQAAVTINVVESGGDVIGTSSGSINLAALSGPVSTFQNTGEIAGTEVQAGLSKIVVGPSSTADLWIGAVPPAIFSTGGSFADSFDGGSTYVGAIRTASSNGIYVPLGYVSGTPVDGTSTWTGHTFASLGLIPGTYVFTWGSDATADSLTINIINVDSTNPSLLSSTPADNATGVSTDPPTLSLVFDEPVSYASGLIRMYKTSDDSEVNNRSVSGSTGSGTPNISISFENGLALDTEYYVLIPAGAFEDAAGNPYAGISSTTELSFSTGVAAPTYAVGGTVSGLTGTGLALENMGIDTLPIATDGPFTFATELEVGFSYVVTVSTEPTGQTCTVSNGSGTISDADVTDVAVTCTDNPEPLYTINGSASGLGPNSVTLQNNLTDDLDVDANGVFVFDTALPDGSSYDVTVLTQPTGQTCDVTNGFGTISSTDVLGVDVDCVDDVVAPPTPTPTIPIPTLSEWALILLAMFIGLMVFANRRRLF